MKKYIIYESFPSFTQILVTCDSSDKMVNSIYGFAIDYTNHLNVIDGIPYRMYCIRSEYLTNILEILEKENFSEVFLVNCKDFHIDLTLDEYIHYSGGNEPNWNTK